MKSVFFFLVGSILILGSIYLVAEERLVKEEEIRILKVGEVSIEVEVANTFETRARGLSNRESLERGHGMFFIFDEPAIYGFWMKEMRFPIDIVWLDSEFKVRGIEKNVSPASYPEIFYPNEPIKYVLELPSGDSEFFGIDMGEILYLE